MRPRTQGSTRRSLGNVFFDAKLKQAVKNGDVSQSELDDHVRRVLRSMFAAGVVDDPPTKQAPAAFRHAATAQRIEEQSIVLLRNEGKILPLRPSHVCSVLDFPHISGKDRNGNFKVRRKTIGKPMRAKLQEVKQQLRARMHEPIEQTGERLKSIVRGYFNHHAVPGNIDSLNVFTERLSFPPPWQGSRA